MFSTVALPRKWSTRWMWSSGTSAARVALRWRADSSLEPNGFSMTSRVPAGTWPGASASQASWLTRGGRAK